MPGGVNGSIDISEFPVLVRLRSITGKRWSIGPPPVARFMLFARLIGVVGEFCDSPRETEYAVAVPGDTEHEVGRSVGLVCTFAFKVGGLAV